MVQGGIRVSCVQLLITPAHSKERRWSSFAVFISGGLHEKKNIMLAPLADPDHLPLYLFFLLTGKTLSCTIRQRTVQIRWQELKEVPDLLGLELKLVNGVYL